MKNVFDYYDEMVRPQDAKTESNTESEKMFEVENEPENKNDYSADIQKANERIAELEKMIAGMTKGDSNNAGDSESVCE